MNGEMTKMTLKHVKNYDGEFPNKNFKVIKYLDLTEFDFEEIVNKHRNKEIWQQKNNWELINKI